MPLYRAHSLRDVVTPTGSFRNPYLEKERRPRDTKIELHIAFGEWFLGKYGVDYRRRALLCTGEINIAKGYVDATKALVEILPIGHFSVCFSSNCFDLFGHFQFSECRHLENIHKVGDELEKLGFIELINDGLELAANSGNELMLYAENFTYRRLSMY